MKPQIMKAINYTAFALFLPLTVLTADYSIDFTSAEGYVDGALGGAGANANNDWSYSDGSTFVVQNSATTGELKVTPSGNNHEAVHNSDFVGSTAFTITTDFRVSYSVGDTAVVSPGSGSGATVVGFGADSGADGVFFRLRRIAGDGRFNIQTKLAVGGSTIFSVFSNGIDAADLGLAFDEGTKLWTGGDSDLLRLEATLSWNGSDYVSDITLLNLDDAGSLVQAHSKVHSAATDDNGGFQTATKNALIATGTYADVFSPDSMAVESFALSSIPEVSSFALFTALTSVGLILMRRRRAA